MGLRWSLAAGLAASCALAQGCTDGTTPDCADAQCAVVSVVEAGADGAPIEAGEGGEAATGETPDAGVDATQVTVRDAGSVSDGGGDATPTPGDAASDAADGQGGG